jgi:hypothetical protein
MGVIFIIFTALHVSAYKQAIFIYQKALDDGLLIGRNM